MSALSTLSAVGSGAAWAARGLFRGAKHAVTHYPKQSAIAATVVAGGVGLFHLGTELTFSDGSQAGRQGYVTKLSYKGGSWKTLFLPICKSWEGELSMGNFKGGVNGGTSNTFEFSVLDKAVVDQVIDAYNTSKHVSLGYNQTFTHWPCQRDTDYIITSVRPLGTDAQPSAFAPQP